MLQSRGHEAQTVHSSVWRKTLPDCGMCTQRRGAVGAAGLALTRAAPGEASPLMPSVAARRNDVVRTGAGRRDKICSATPRRDMPAGDLLLLVLPAVPRDDDGSMRCIMSSAAGKAAF